MDDDYESAGRRLVDQTEEFLAEMPGARVIDANMAWLREVDPDARRLLVTGFVDCLIDNSLMKTVGEESRAYVAAKVAEGRMDLVDMLFEGVDGHH